MARHQSIRDLETDELLAIAEEKYHSGQHLGLEPDDDDIEVAFLLAELASRAADRTPHLAEESAA